MSFTTIVDPEFAGPTLKELLPVLGDLPIPIEVRWAGSAEDHRLYEQHQHLAFVFVAPSADVAERAIWRQGGSITLGQEELDAAKQALTSRGSTAWRGTSEGLGAARSTLLLTKIVGDALRAGKTPRVTALATLDCLHKHVSPQDVDVLIRLRSPRK